jgi:uncharacterized protein
MTTRREPIDKRHADTAALLYGPLVLFGIDAAGRTFARNQLLTAEQTSSNSWQAGPSLNPPVLRHFFAPDDYSYSTYFKVTGQGS